MTECKIRGPYLPVGDTDWECVRHEVNARLKEDAQARINAGLLDPNEARKSDFYCPVGRVVESLAELGAVSEEKVEEIITSVLIEDSTPPPPGSGIHELMEYYQSQVLDARTLRAEFDRFYEAGGNHPITYGGDTNPPGGGVRGMRAERVVMDEAFGFPAAPVEPEDLIGAQVSIMFQTDAKGFVSKVNEVRVQSDALAGTMRRINSFKRPK